MTAAADRTFRRTLVAIGKRVKAVRKARGHTSYSLAAALGISQAHVSRVETGLQGLRCVTLLRLAKILNVSPVVFLIDEHQASRLCGRLSKEEMRGLSLICGRESGKRRA